MTRRTFTQHAALFVLGCSLSVRAAIRLPTIPKPSISEEQTQFAQIMGTLKHIVSEHNAEFLHKRAHRVVEQSG